MAVRPTLLTVAFLLAAGPACLRLDQFIYWPERTDEYGLDPSLVPEGDRAEVELTAADGTRLAAVEVHAAEGNGRSILYFHGTDGHIDDAWPRVARLYELGFDVLVVDYRGYGRSEGTPSEAGLYLDGAAAWRHLTGPLGVAPQDVVVYGHSLGGGVACEVALRHRPGALVLESTFSSVADQIQGSLYLDVPRGLMADAEYDNVGKVAQMPGFPKLILHGEKDGTFPPVNARRLFEAATAPRRLVLFPSAGHGTVYESAPERYRAEVRGAAGTAP